jgi:hypothetical protein
VAGAFYGGYRGVTAIWHHRAIERAIPNVLTGLRGQRDMMVDAIESYKKQFGFYPPLFTAAGPERGLLNPLCYELLGVRFEPKTAQFYIPSSKDGLSADEAQKYFNARSFSNCFPFPALPTNFMANRPFPITPLVKDIDLYGIGVGYTEFTPEALWEDFEFTPWRYVTNPAQHNPGKFDLWIEANVDRKHFTIGNWAEVK